MFISEQSDLSLLPSRLDFKKRFRWILHGTNLAVPYCPTAGLLLDSMAVSRDCHVTGIHEMKLDNHTNIIYISGHAG